MIEESQFHDLFIPKLCAKCWGKIRFITNPYCNLCGAPLEYKDQNCFSCEGKQFAFDYARAATVYDEFMKKLIITFKHGYKTEYAKLFAKWTRGIIDLNFYDYIIPLPLHKHRLYSRGFNQSAMIAKYMCSPHLEKINTHLLLRHKNTKPQGHRTIQDRSQNVKDAFHVADAHKVKGKKILLIDDVMTSGATLNECAELLKASGAINVHILVVARAILKSG